MAGRQRIDRVRRQYNQWVANQTLEDYALRFTAKSARDVMVPHVDVCAVPDTAPVAEVVALVQERGFSRLPVFH